MRRAAAILALVTGLAGAGPVARAEDEPPAGARQLLLEASRALAEGRKDDARESLDRLRDALPSDHWLQEVVVELRLAVEAPSPAGVAGVSARDDESVASAYISLALFGVGTGGWLFGSILETNEQVGVPLSVVLMGGGIYGAYALDRAGMTGAAADGLTYGLLVGLVEGLILLNTVFEPDSDRAFTTGLWGATLAGGLLGGAAAQSLDATRGQVLTAFSATVWGGLLGFFAAAAMTIDDEDELALATTGGSALGLGLGALLASERPLPPARAVYVDLGGIAGLFVGGAVIALVGTNDDEVNFGIAGGGIAAGLGVAWYLTDGMADEPRSAFDVRLAPTANGLALLGSF